MMFSILFMVLFEIWCVCYTCSTSHLGLITSPVLRVACGHRVSEARMRSICAQSIGTPAFVEFTFLIRERISKQENKMDFNLRRACFLCHSSVSH